MPVTQDQAARRFCFLLLIASTALVGAVVWPLASALFIAGVLAVVLAPLENYLSARLGGRRGLASGILVLAVLFLLIGPLIGLTTFLVTEATEGAKFILDTARSEGVSGLVDRLPGPLDAWATSVLARLGDLGQLLERQVSERGAKAASAIASVLAAAGSFAFELVMMLIALFFILVHGGEFLAWLDSASPLRPGQTRELYEEFKKVSYAVIVATLVTVLVQAIVALVGYLIAKVPHPIFFATDTFFVGMIPAIGAAGVCLFAALILLITGHPYMALFLAIWGMVVVGLIDNVVKPFLIKGDLEMGGAVVFFALIGGIAAFGMVGVLIGPLAVASFLALLRMYQRDFEPRT